MAPVTQNMFFSNLDLQIAPNPPSPRKLFLMRHGERVDFTFGSWIPYCFDESGKYIRKDLNMPDSLPQRKQGPKGYHKDAPLTKVGMFQATLVGEGAYGIYSISVVFQIYFLLVGLRDSGTSLQHVYCSPALRCIQTCDAVLKGMGKQKELKIKIEPGLFEWLFWYPDQLPDWMSPDELAAEGYNIDLTYQPFVERSELLESGESCEQFYLRSHFVTQSVLSTQITGNVLFMGHTATLEVCSRELTGKKPRTTGTEMIDVIRKIPYCALLTIAQNDEKWEVVESPCPPVTHTNNQRFDSSVLNVS